MKPTIIENQKGPRLLLLNNPQAKTVFIEAIVRVGSRNENKDTSGISHILEHMVFKGTKNYPKNDSISREFDSLGASYNASTSKFVTRFYCRVESHHIEKGLSLISDMVFRPLLKGKDWDRERGVIVEELKMYKENPIMHIDSLADESFYGESTPLGRDIGGTPEHVAKITIEEIKKYWQENYLNGDVTLAVIGKLKEKEIINKIKKYFPQNKKYSQEYNVPFERMDMFGDIKKDERDIKQIQTVFSWPAPDHDDPNYFAYLVATTILGGNMSSRLFNEVREKNGLAYSINMYIQPMLETSVVRISAGLDASRYNKAVEVITNTLKKFLKSGPTDKEMKQAKTFFSGSHAIRFEKPSAYADWYVDRSIWGLKVFKPELNLEKVLKVNKRQVREVMKEMMELLPAIAYIGPKISDKELEVIQNKFKI